MHKLIEYICEELDEMERKVDKGGKLSMSEIQYGDVLAHFKKNLLKSEEMMEEFDEGYSSEKRPMNGTMRDGSYRYDVGMSYARGDVRGRGRNANRDSMGRYSSERGYSRDAADMTAEFQEMMDDPKYAPIKHDIERLMRKVETM